MQRKTTDKQHRSNRQNATHSTGPVTDPGKAASSQNSFRHGLTASAMVMLAGEQIQDFLALANGVRAEQKPTTVMEDALVTKMIEGLWLSARAVKLQQTLLLEPVFNEKRFNLFMRYQTMHDRVFTKAFNDLVTLRKQAQVDESGFVLQERAKQLHEAKIRHWNARSEAQETATHQRKSRNPLQFVVTTASESLQPVVSSPNPPSH